MGLIFDAATAGLYDAWTLSPQGRAVEKALERLVPELLAPRPGERVLDIGCGSGHHLIMFNRMGLNVSGVDASAEMVRRARKRLGHRCTLQAAFAEDLPFDDNAFDVAVLINTVEFLDDPLGALAEAGRVARKKVFVGVFNSLSWNGLLRRAHGFFGDPLFGKARLYNLWEITSLVRSALGPVPIAWSCIRVPPRIAGAVGLSVSGSRKRIAFAFRVLSGDLRQPGVPAPHRRPAPHCASQERRPRPGGHQDPRGPQSRKGGLKAMKEAYLYDKLEKGRVRCALCNHRCLIEEGGRGRCGVRENRAGTLYSLVYDQVIARHCDPIEKKPLYHFLPASLSYSIATAGCNFSCRFCQNADISQLPADHGRIVGEHLTPEAIVNQALAFGCRSIAYTYTEPTIYFELALDTSRIAVSRGLKNVFVSNGYMTPGCLAEIHPDLHAANVDLKAFSNDFYKAQCGAKLAPVLETLAAMKRQGVWLEVTTLLIPGLNDDPRELGKLAGFLVSLDPDIPWHISRFHPTYRLTDRSPTPASTVHRARDIGFEAGLHYVYTGNLPGDQGEKTCCHGCGGLLVDRIGFSVSRNRVTKGCCPDCGSRIPGVWSD